MPVLCIFTYIYVVDEFIPMPYGIEEPNSTYINHKHSPDIYTCCCLLFIQFPNIYDLVNIKLQALKLGLKRISLISISLLLLCLC